MMNLDLQPPATNSTFYWGLIVAPKEAIAGDINAFDPSGLADRTLDWMLWHGWHMYTVANGEQVRHELVQTRSQRKIERVGESLFFIGRGITTNINVQGTTSTLVLLP
jgi:hypothetical protein